MKRFNKKKAFMPITVEGDAIFFDMDGVIAEWNTGGIEPTKEPGFFVERPVVEKAVNLIHILRDKGYSVYILSSVYTDGTAAKDKYKWLCGCGLGQVPFVFVPYGEAKADYITGDGVHVLIDDYSKNLHEWKKNGGIGVKYMNAFNGNHGTWRGIRLTDDMTAEEMGNIVEGIFQGGAA